MSKKTPSVVVGRDGIPCPRCGQPTEIHEHPTITEKHLRQPFYYSRWFNCANPNCSTSLIMRDEFLVWNNNEKGQELRRLRAIQDQLKVPA